MANWLALNLGNQIQKTRWLKVNTISVHNGSIFFTFGIILVLANQIATHQLLLNCRAMNWFSFDDHSSRACVIYLTRHTKNHYSHWVFRCNTKFTSAKANIYNEYIYQSDAFHISVSIQFERLTDLCEMIQNINKTHISFSFLFLCVYFLISTIS